LMSVSRLYYFPVLLVTIVLFSCRPESANTLFDDLGPAETGLRFANVLSNSEQFNMIDYLYYYDGGGVAVGDINNDGLSDIYLVSNEGQNGLFLNLGNMKFKDISQTAGVTSPGKWKNGVSMVDINGDGLLDIYQCRLGDYKGIKGKNELYVNQGDLTFTEEAAKYNLDFVGFSTQAAFFDMDNDGDLDVYLLNHSVHSRRSFGTTDLRIDVDSAAGDKLYRNDGLLYKNISAEAGIFRSQIGYGLGIGLSDINRDGYTDIFISNDFTENDYLYLNNKDGTFNEVFPKVADHASLSSMGNDLADFNNDGLTDIFTLDMLPRDAIVMKSTIGEDPEPIFRMKISFGYMPQYKRNTLQLNRGDGTFSDIAMMAGVHSTDWSWAPLLADFDNDAWKDIFISNGIPGRPNDKDYLEFIEQPGVMNNPSIPDSVLLMAMPEGKVANYFYRNNQDLTFQDVSDKWGVAPQRITNGIAYGDLDNDGDLDLVLNNLNANAVIKRNNTNMLFEHNYLAIDLHGNNGNSKAIGAKVEVFDKERYQYHESFPVRGFKSSVEPRLHLGLGSSKVIDSIKISWPIGGMTTLTNVNANQLLDIVAPTDHIQTMAESSGHAAFEKIPSGEMGVNYVHLENKFIEFNREPLIPHMHSQEGPALAIADINGDGLDDFFVGGAKYQAGTVYIQQKSGFIALKQEALIEDKLTEDVDACFFDFDKDGDQDLVVVSGGNEFIGESNNRQPRLYENNGTGIFTELSSVFAGIYHTGSAVAVHDYDGDGWEDLFFGSLVEPWNYGAKPQSFLLRNINGKTFENRTEVLPQNGYFGMINDATWVDLDNNGSQSLVLVGEWMEVTIINVKEKEFDMVTIPQSQGWWKAVEHVDIDNDGDQDLLVGNLGLNSKIKASKKDPLRLYLNDFDKNGKIDPLITTSLDGREELFSYREQLQRQIPSIGSQYPNHKLYAEASIKDLFGNKLSEAEMLKVTELRSGIFVNDGSGFRFKAFPNIMQISVIQDFLVSDFNADGQKDLFTVGNLYAATMKEGRYAGGRGMFCLGPFSQWPNPMNVRGLGLKGDKRSAKQLLFQGEKFILIATNNDSLQWIHHKQ
jgi:hypothetical protein